MQVTFKLPVSWQIPGYFHVSAQTNNDLKEREREGGKGWEEKKEKEKEGREINLWGKWVRQLEKEHLITYIILYTLSLFQPKMENQRRKA